MCIALGVCNFPHNPTHRISPISQNAEKISIWVTFTICSYGIVIDPANDQQLPSRKDVGHHTKEWSFCVQMESGNWKIQY
jgi:hypothetical protein